MKARHGFFVLILLFALTACPEEHSVWLARGSTIERVEFIFGKQRGKQRAVSLGFLRVIPCRSENREAPGDSTAAWDIEAKIGDGERRLSSITYGETPAGYDEIAPARPLSRWACYIVITNGGQTGFQIGERGLVRELSEDEVARKW